MAGSFDYFQMLKAVENYYGASSDQWLTMANWTGYRSSEVASILRQTPGVNTIVNESGDLIGWSLEGSAATATASEAAAAVEAAAINSNAASVASAAAPLSIPGNVMVQTAPNTISIASGATKVANGSRVATAAGHIGTWVLGAGVGMKLGVWIDAAAYRAYEAGHDHGLWDTSEVMEYCNPERWKESKVTNWLYDYSGYDDFMAYFNADDQQVYVDENLFALMAQYLNGIGAFSTGNTEMSIDDTSPLYNQSGWNFPITLVNAPFVLQGVNYTGEYSISVAAGNPNFALFSRYVSGAVAVEPYAFSDSPFTVHVEGMYGTHDYPATPQTKEGGETYYVWFNVGGFRNPNNVYPANVFDNYRIDDNLSWDCEYIFKHGYVHGGGGVEGINPYDDVPVGITNQMTPEQIVQLLKQQYPELWDDAIKTGTLNDDGTVTDRIYIPIALPTGGPEGEPTTDPQHPGSVDPENKTQTQTVTKIITPTPNPVAPTDPETGEGDTPIPILPTGAADALYSIYNPTLAEVRSFGAWLWSPNFVDQLLKVFSDPMQAIISLHKIYLTPHTDAPQPIKVGYLTSNVSAKVVDQQYIEVDCGTVNLLEKSGNVFDYSPFTDVRLYLPFIGIVRLDVADIMRSKISVKYRCDVITGTIAAFVNVSRDSAGGTIYQYTGSCAEHFPLSSGSYMGIVGGLLTMAAGITTAVASGGATIPLAGAAVARGAANAHTNVECSNGFTANAGAMSIKKPYLIVSKQQSAMANNVSHMVGMPANYFVKLSSCSGRIKVRAVYVDSIANATDKEKNMIESSLRSGVLL